MDDTGKISCKDSTESMPVGRIRAFRSKQCSFWANFGYVVPEIKYAPKLVELISNNGYGPYFMKLGGALAAKIIDIDRQHGRRQREPELSLQRDGPCGRRQCDPELLWAAGGGPWAVA